jgi:hypothetical protein
VICPTLVHRNVVSSSLTHRHRNVVFLAQAWRSRVSPALARRRAASTHQAPRVGAILIPTWRTVASPALILPSRALLAPTAPVRASEWLIPIRPGTEWAIRRIAPRQSSIPLILTWVTIAGLIITRPALVDVLPPVAPLILGQELGMTERIAQVAKGFGAAGVRGVGIALPGQDAGDLVTRRGELKHVCGQPARRDRHHPKGVRAPPPHVTVGLGELRPCLRRVRIGLQGLGLDQGEESSGRKAGQEGRDRGIDPARRVEGEVAGVAGDLATDPSFDLAAADPIPGGREPVA